MGCGNAWLGQCWRKRHHATEAEAEAAAASIEASGGGRIGWSRCPYCGGWVTGRRSHKPAGRRSGPMRRPRPKAAARATWDGLKRRGA